MDSSSSNLPHVAAGQVTATNPHTTDSRSGHLLKVSADVGEVGQPKSPRKQMVAAEADGPRTPTNTPRLCAAPQCPVASKNVTEIFGLDDNSDATSSDDESGNGNASSSGSSSSSDGTSDSSEYTSNSSDQEEEESDEETKGSSVGASAAGSVVVSGSWISSRPPSKRGKSSGKRRKRVASRCAC